MEFSSHQLLYHMHTIHPLENTLLYDVENTYHACSSEASKYHSEIKHSISGMFEDACSIHHAQSYKLTITIDSSWGYTMPQYE